MKLRLALLDDYVAIHTMYNEWKHVVFSIESYEQYLKTNLLFVVELEENKNSLVVGTCKVLLEPKLMYDKNVAHIEDVVVLSSHRKHGVGAFMIQQVIKWCQTQNVYKVRLGCLPELEPFYLKTGLKRTGYDMTFYCLDHASCPANTLNAHSI